MKLVSFLIAASVLASSPQGLPAKDVSPDAAIPTTRVITFEEPANGLTRDKMTPEFLQALTQSWAESYRQSTPDKKIEKGVSFEPRYVDYASTRLALIEMRVNNTAVGAGIFGLVDNSLMRVICLDRTGGPVNLRSGECGDKIREVFGVSISGERG